MPSTRSDDRGAILIQTAIAIVVLTSMCAFVLDMGVVWLARGQAQNAADAGALAGATARVFDEPAAVPAPGGPTETSAVYTATQNRVFGKVPGVPAPTYECPESAYGGPSPSGCVRVDVFMDGQQGPALPSFFANMFGVASQKVRATATAQAADANATDCLQPWAMPDYWVEEPITPPSAAITYRGPTEGTPTGFTQTDFQNGRQVILGPGDLQKPLEGFKYYAFEEGGAYEDAITGCTVTRQDGDLVTTLPVNVAIETGEALATLIANGPVIVPVALFDPREYVAAQTADGRFNLHIVNIIGLRITGTDPSGMIVGTIAAARGEIKAGPTVGGSSSLLKTITLVR
jgi:Putative Flp pilus-assembly TadE/G-like